MIPRIIHYCWFGGNPLSPLAERCIDSWHKYCPDYELKLWNEDNFDVSIYRYSHEAYTSKKWAFVSDVARLWALINYGGIYLDTDCELLKPIDEFLELDAVSGFETANRIPTALLGCQKGFALFARLLDEYACRCFIQPNGEFDTTTNVVSITNSLIPYGLVLNNRLQTVSGFTLYPSEFFCPKNYDTGELIITKNTYAIHHFDSSWHSEQQRLERKKVLQFKKYFGSTLVNAIYGTIINFRASGIRGVYKKMKEKIGEHK